MFMRRRGILIGIGILALATVSLAATVQVYFFRLPDPSEADGRGIIRWMVTRDLSQESPDIRRSLLLRIREVLAEQKFGSGSGSIGDKLAPEYRETFFKNVDTMLEEWFHMQAERYAATHVSDQTAVLDSILDEAQSLSSFRRNKSADSDSTESASKGSNHPAEPDSSPGNQVETDPITAATRFIENMNTWIERAPPEKQKQLRHFAAALQARIAVRSFQGLMQSLQGNKQPAPGK